MKRSIELKINKLLREGQSPVQIADQLLLEWGEQKLTHSQIESVGRYLINSGHYPRLVKRIAIELEANRSIPWSAFARALTKTKKSLNEEDVEYLITGAKEQKRVNEFAMAPFLEKISSSYKSLRLDILNRLSENHKLIHKELIAKLDYCRINRMVKQEGVFLQEFRSIFPNDPALKIFDIDYQKRHAGEFIERLLRQKRSLAPDYRASYLMNEEMQAAAKPLYQESISIVKEDPRLGFDFAMIFYFMDLFKEALEIIKLAPPSRAIDWLSLELLMASRRFVDAMEVARKLELKYSDDPESTFASTYARAKCLWELGERQLAIGLIKGIVNIRPSFRAAHTLLVEWTGELE